MHLRDLCLRTFILLFAVLVLHLFPPVPSPPENYTYFDSEYAVAPHLTRAVAFTSDSPNTTLVASTKNHSGGPATDKISSTKADAPSLHSHDNAVSPDMNTDKKRGTTRSATSEDIKDYSQTLSKVLSPVLTMLHSLSGSKVKIIQVAEAGSHNTAARSRARDVGASDVGFEKGLNEAAGEEEVQDSDMRRLDRIKSRDPIVDTEDSSNTALSDAAVHLDAIRANEPVDAPEHTSKMDLGGPSYNIDSSGMKLGFGGCIWGVVLAVAIFGAA